MSRPEQSNLFAYEALVASTIRMAAEAVCSELAIKKFGLLCMRLVADTKDPQAQQQRSIKLHSRGPICIGPHRQQWGALLGELVATNVASSALRVSLGTPLEAMNPESLDLVVSHGDVSIGPTNEGATYQYEASRAVQDLGDLQGVLDVWAGVIFGEVDLADAYRQLADDT